MKKVFAILAIAGLMVACNNKKKDETKTNADTTMQPTMAPDTTHMAPMDTTHPDTTSHM
jgi:hypothetical protein